MWVLNRVGRHNLKQDVTATLETALNQGFHMFREAGHLEQGLHSMWFPDAEKEKGVGYFATVSQLIETEKRKLKLLTGQLPDQRGMQIRMNAPASAADKATSSSSSTSSAKDWTGGEIAGQALLAMLKGTPVAANGNSSGGGGGGGGGSASISSSSGSSASGSLSSRSIHSHHASVGPIASSSTVDPSVAALFSSAAAAAAAAASSSTQHHAQAQSTSPPPLPPLLQQLMSTASSASTPSAIFTPSKVTPSLSSETSSPPPPSSSSSSSSAFRRGGGGDDFLHAPLTLNKDQLKSLLLELVNEDAFVDLLHASYLKNEAKKRAQRVL